MLFRGVCYKQQNQITENENGTQKKKNVHIGVGFYHMYTKGWTMCNSFVAKGDLMQQPLCPKWSKNGPNFVLHIFLCIFYVLNLGDKKIATYISILRFPNFLIYVLSVTK